MSDDEEFRRAFGKLWRQPADTMMVSVHQVGEQICTQPECRSTKAMYLADYVCDTYQLVLIHCNQLSTCFLVLLNNLFFSNFHLYNLPA